STRHSLSSLESRWGQLASLRQFDRRDSPIFRAGRIKFACRGANAKFDMAMAARYFQLALTYYRQCYETQASCLWNAADWVARRGAWPGGTMRRRRRGGEGLFQYRGQAVHSRKGS